MNVSREDVQRQMVKRQIGEVDMLITQLRDAATVSELCETELAVISRTTAARAARNLEDLQKRFLTGLAEG